MPQTVPTNSTILDHQDIVDVVADNATDAEARFAAAESAIPSKLNISGLPVITITDAAVTMLVNRRYAGSIAAFTADRNYTVPAGTAGDVIDIQLTTGDDAFELIIIGATGVSINGGAAATEWSRLFINNEFVRLRCHATNDWRVEVDGRIPQSARMSLATTVTNAFPTTAYTKIPADTINYDNASIASASTDQYTVRRNSRYRVTFGGYTSLTSNSLVAQAININGTRTVLQAIVHDGTISNDAAPGAVSFKTAISVGHVVFPEFLQSSPGSTNALGSGRCWSEITEEFA